MNRRFFSLLLLSSWILGISLICLFPPVSDFSHAEMGTGCITKECLPELNLKNSSRSRVELSADLFADIQGFVPVQWDGEFSPIELTQLVTSSERIRVDAFFDVKVLFRQFFETF